MAGGPAWRIVRPVMALGIVARFYGLDRARQLARSLEYQWNEDPSNDPFALPEAGALE